MQIEKTAIPDVILFKPKKIGDDRGYFMETFRKSAFEKAAGEYEFIQDNQSLSVQAGTVRGLHFQLNPMAQGKLVRCIAGALMDVVVDIRRGSPSFGRYASSLLTEENGHQLWIPPGFAHGFCTLEAMTVIAYKVTNYYSAEHDRGLLWNDPELAIDWPAIAANAVVSVKDANQPRLADLQDCFHY